MADARFSDGKDKTALRTIGEVSSALGIKPHVLRYWEAQFPMLQPLKRSGSRRYYRAADIALVETIDRLVNREGYTLRGARNAIAAGEGADEPEARVAAQPMQANAGAASGADTRSQLIEIRDRLIRALDS
jgi:DNA-binding transcriptional MerR regulator